MRHVFWALFCGLVSYGLAAKANSIVGLRSAAGVFVYGAVIGVGFAFASAKEVKFSRLFRFAVGTSWMLLTTALYFAVFSSVSNASGSGVVVRGALLALPAPLIWVFRHARGLRHE
jgi:hypothetical protein